MSVTMSLRDDGAEYSLLADAGGSCFILRCKSENMAAHLVGDDAARFAADYQIVRAQQPGWGADQTLAQLWDQGGYSWLAQAEEPGGGPA